MRLSTEERRLDGLCLTAGGLTWLLVLAAPIGVGIGIHRHFPSVPALVPWLCGLVVFDLLFIFSEFIWRNLRWLLTAGKLS